VPPGNWVGKAVAMILVSMLIFQIKHFLCDFALQSSNQIRNKGVYLHPAGLTHAGLHALGSVPAMLVLTRSPLPVIVLPLLEFAFHYHTDWGKVRLDSHLRLNDTNTLYWIIFGGDQLIHQLTYIAMIAAAIYLF
jgi:hypothetical protein